MHASVLAPTRAPVDWMRIYAARLAHRRPEVSAAEAVRTAIAAFRSCGHLPPEQAVAEAGGMARP